jgi:hypothetical protein
VPTNVPPSIGKLMVKAIFKGRSPAREGESAAVKQLWVLRFILNLSRTIKDLPSVTGDVRSGKAKQLLFVM